MTAQYVLKLYITGQTPRSLQAIENLHYTCQKVLKDQYELIIVDVLENPQMAEDDKILATPTLVKLSPPPLRRVIGDMSQTDKVLFGLDLGSYVEKKG
jgi:circadian clock protein KaiB